VVRCPSPLLQIWSAKLDPLIDAMQGALDAFVPYASGGNEIVFPALFRTAWGDFLRSFGLNPTPSYSPKPTYPKVITRGLDGRALHFSRNDLWWSNARHEAKQRAKNFHSPYALCNKLFREETKRRADAAAKAAAAAAAVAAAAAAAEEDDGWGPEISAEGAGVDVPSDVPSFADGLGVSSVPLFGSCAFFSCGHWPLPRHIGRPRRSLECAGDGTMPASLQRRLCSHR
jgi:hypothetical protein